MLIITLITFFLFNVNILLNFKNVLELIQTFNLTAKQIYQSKISS